VHARFKYSLSKAEYGTGVQHLVGELSHNVPQGNRLAFELLGVSTLTGLASILLFPTSFVAVIFTIVEMAGLGAILQWRLRKRPGGLTFDPRTAESISVTFNDGGIVDGNSVRRRRWQWSSVRKLLDRDGMFVLVMAGWDMIVLPKRLWSSRDDQLAFAREINARIVVRPPEATAADQRDSIDLSLGAIGVAVIVLSITVPLSIVPLNWLPTSSAAVRVSVVLLEFALSGLIAYFAWRAARHGFGRLAGKRAGLAKCIAFAVIWVFPVYWLISYLSSS